MPIKNDEMSVPIVAKLRILFVEDLISSILTRSDPEKSKKLSTIPRINFEKSSDERLCSIDCTKSPESLPEVLIVWCVF